MYGDGEYWACMPARRSIAVTASTSARSSSIWRASVQRLSCLRETGARLVNARQDDHRDLAGGLLPVVVETGVDVGVLAVKSLVLIALRHARAGVGRFATSLHGHLGVRHQVVVPRRVRGRAALGRDDHQMVAVARVDERGLANLFRLGPFGAEDQHVTALERARGRLPVRANILDQVSIELLKACAHRSVIPLEAAWPFPAL